MPITPKPETRDAVLAAANELATQLRAITWHGAPPRGRVVDVNLSKARAR